MVQPSNKKNPVSDLQRCQFLHPQLPQETRIQYNTDKTWCVWSEGWDSLFLLDQENLCSSHCCLHLHIENRTATVSCTLFQKTFWELLGNHYKVAVPGFEISPAETSAAATTQSGRRAKMFTQLFLLFFFSINSSNENSVFYTTQQPYPNLNLQMQFYPEFYCIVVLFIWLKIFSLKKQLNYRLFVSNSLPPCPNCECCT